MTLLELKEKVDALIEHYEHYEVTIPIQGIGGATRRLESVSIGFDWRANQILLSFDALNSIGNLADFDTRRFYKLRGSYFRKVSNLRKVMSGEKIARYGKEEKEFATSREAEKWIYERFNEDFS